MRRLLQLLRRCDNWAERVIFDRLMPRHGAKIALAVLAALLVGATWMSFDTPTPTEDGIKSATDAMQWFKDRPWWDKYPNDRKATYHVYIFTKRGNGGVFLAAYVTLTAWRANYEFFVYKTVGKKLLYYFPESQTKGYTEIDIAEVKRGRFDLKLAMKQDPKSSASKKEYFSWKRSRGSAMDQYLKKNLEAMVDSKKLPAEFR